MKAPSQAEAPEPTVNSTSLIPYDHLDDEILEEYRLVRSSAQNMVLHAYRCGKRAIQKQKEPGMERGDWMRWVETRYNGEISYSTLNAYQKVAREIDKLGGEPNLSVLKFTSVRGVLAYCYAEKHGEPSPSEKRKAAKARRKADPELELDELPKEQRKLVRKIIHNHDLVRVEKFNADLAGAIEKAVRKRMKELDRREVELNEREIALKAREEKLWQRGRTGLKTARPKVITRRKAVQQVVARVSKRPRAPNVGTSSDGQRQSVTKSASPDLAGPSSNGSASEAVPA